MRVGIVSDLHCNLQGLDLALQAMGDVDELLCLGDSIFEYQFSNDVVARFLAMKLSEAWGQQVIIDNRAGAGGNIGAQMVAQSTRCWGFWQISRTDGISSLRGGGCCWFTRRRGTRAGSMCIRTARSWIVSVRRTRILCCMGIRIARW